MTMRELWWMCRERKRVQGELVAWQTTLVRLAVWGPEQLPELTELNPYRVEEPKTEAILELEAWQARRRWRVMFGSNGDAN